MSQQVAVTSSQEVSAIHNNIAVDPPSPPYQALPALYPEAPFHHLYELIGTYPSPPHHGVLTLMTIAIDNTNDGIKTKISDILNRQVVAHALRRVGETTYLMLKAPEGDCIKGLSVVSQQVPFKEGEWRIVDTDEYASLMSSFILPANIPHAATILPTISHDYRRQRSSGAFLGIEQSSHTQPLSILSPHIRRARHAVKNSPQVLVKGLSTTFTFEKTTQALGSIVGVVAVGPHGATVGSHVGAAVGKGLDAAAGSSKGKVEKGKKVEEKKEAEKKGEAERPPTEERVHIHELFKKDKITRKDWLWSLGAISTEEWKKTDETKSPSGEGEE